MRATAEPGRAFSATKCVVDAWDAIGGEGPSVRELLAAAASAISQERSTAPKACRLGDGPPAPIPDPEKILCIGLNYRSHAEETKQTIPDVPTVFAKFRNALAAPGATVELPKASEKVDYEAEVCIVIGKRLKEVDAETALAGVAGYTLMNDLSARDLQLATTQWISGKSFDGAGPCGPALVTADEAGAHDEIEFSLTLNGEEMQRSSTVGPDLQGARACLAHLEADDARARRSDLDRHAVGRRDRASAERLAQARRRDRDQLAAAGPSSDEDRVAASPSCGLGRQVGGRIAEQARVQDQVVRRLRGQRH